MKSYLKLITQSSGTLNQSNSAFSLSQVRKPLLYSLSGGQDSTSLFFLLFHLFNTVQLFSDKTSFLGVLYCHHFWQPKNLYLLEFIFQLTFLFHCQFFSSLAKLSLPNENRSRRWRKKTLSRISLLQKTQSLLTGYTETDRIETILTNLTRGTTWKSFSNGEVFISKKQEMFFFSSFLEISTKSFCFYTNSFKVFEKNVVFRIHFYNTNFQLQRFKTDSDFILFQKKTFFFSQKKSQVLNFERSKRNSHFFSFFRQKSFLEKNLRQSRVFSSSFCFSSFSSTEILWWKPFATIKRLVILNFRDFYEFPVFTDLTNFSCQFSRNKIRHQFLPFFKLLFHQNVNGGILQCFQISGDEYKILENKIQQVEFILLISESRVIRKSDTRGGFRNVTGPLWFLKHTPNSLQLAFLQKLLFKYRTLEGTFFQISTIKSQLGKLD